MLQTVRRFIDHWRAEPVSLELAPTAPPGVAANEEVRERNALPDTLGQIRDLAECHLADAQQPFTAVDPAGREAQESADQFEHLRRHIASLNRKIRELERSRS